jgi:hypothetical protein
MSNEMGEHLEDERLTALLDGEGTVADRAHLAGCDRCAERAGALRAVAALVAAPPAPPSEAVRDASVAAALAAADRPVVSVPRPARRRPPAWLLPAAAVVALVALVAVIVPRWGQGTDDAGGDSGDMAARSAPDDGSGGGQDDAAEGGTAPAAEAPALRRADLGELGAVDDEADLAARVEGALGASTGRYDAPAEDRGACDAAVRTREAGLGELVLRATATWRGTPAEVLAYARDGAAGPTRAVVVAVDGCATLATADLP